jgi:hypothetical protein
MNTSSINDTAIDTLKIFSETKDLIKSYNDYGDHTGYCEDFDGIKLDFENALSSIMLRSFRLKRRIELTEKLK